MKPALTCQGKPTLEVTIFILALRVVTKFFSAFHQQICSVQEGIAFVILLSRDVVNQIEHF